MLEFEKKVILEKTKPQDFERSEQIVLIGKVEGDEFHASEILLKCPSKYNDGKPEESSSSSSSALSQLNPYRVFTYLWLLSRYFQVE